MHPRPPPKSYKLVRNSYEMDEMDSSYYHDGYSQPSPSESSYFNKKPEKKEVPRFNPFERDFKYQLYSPINGILNEAKYGPIWNILSFLSILEILGIEKVRCDLSENEFTGDLSSYEPDIFLNTPECHEFIIRKKRASMMYVCKAFEIAVQFQLSKRRITNIEDFFGHPLVGIFRRAKCVEDWWKKKTSKINYNHCVTPYSESILVKLLELGTFSVIPRKVLIYEAVTRGFPIFLESIFEDITIDIGCSLDDFQRFSFRSSLQKMNGDDHEEGLFCAAGSLREKLFGFNYDETGVDLIRRNVKDDQRLRVDLLSLCFFEEDHLRDMELEYRYNEGKDLYFASFSPKKISPAELSKTKRNDLKYSVSFLSLAIQCLLLDQIVEESNFVNVISLLIKKFKYSKTYEYEKVFQSLIYVCITLKCNVLLETILNEANEADIFLIITILLNKKLDISQELRISFIQKIMKRKRVKDIVFVGSKEDRLIKKLAISSCDHLLFNAICSEIGWKDISRYLYSKYPRSACGILKVPYEQKFRRVVMYVLPSDLNRVLAVFTNEEGSSSKTRKLSRVERNENLPEIPEIMLCNWKEDELKYIEFNNNDEELQRVFKYLRKKVGFVDKIQILSFLMDMVLRKCSIKNRLEIVFKGCSLWKNLDSFYRFLGKIDVNLISYNCLDESVCNILNKLGYSLLPVKFEEFSIFWDQFENTFKDWIPKIDMILFVCELFHKYRRRLMYNEYRCCKLVLKTLLIRRKYSSCFHQVFILAFNECSFHLMEFLLEHFSDEMLFIKPLFYFEILYKSKLQYLRMFHEWDVLDCVNDDDYWDWDWDWDWDGDWDYWDWGVSDLSQPFVTTGEWKYFLRLVPFFSKKSVVNSKNAKLKEFLLFFLEEFNDFQTSDEIRNKLQKYKPWFVVVEHFCEVNTENRIISHELFQDEESFIAVIEKKIIKKKDEEEFERNKLMVKIYVEKELMNRKKFVCDKLYGVGKTHSMCESEVEKIKYDTIDKKMIQFFGHPAKVELKEKHFEEKKLISKFKEELIEKIEKGEGVEELKTVRNEAIQQVINDMKIELQEMKVHLGEELKIIEVEKTRTNGREEFREKLKNWEIEQKNRMENEAKIISDEIGRIDKVTHDRISPKYPHRYINSINMELYRSLPKDEAQEYKRFCKSRTHGDKKRLRNEKREILLIAEKKLLDKFHSDEKKRIQELGLEKFYVGKSKKREIIEHHYASRKNGLIASNQYWKKKEEDDKKLVEEWSQKEMVFEVLDSKRKRISQKKVQIQRKVRKRARREGKRMELERKKRENYESQAKKINYPMRNFHRQLQPSVFQSRFYQDSWVRSSFCNSRGKHFGETNFHVNRPQQFEQRPKFERLQNTQRRFHPGRQYSNKVISSEQSNERNVMYRQFYNEKRRGGNIKKPSYEELERIEMEREREMERMHSQRKY